MNIHFVGTGSGKTSLKRFHSSFLISSSNYNLLVDCGDGISRALLKQKINFNVIDAIVISHFHADHFSALPSLITQMKLISRKKELMIFVHLSEKEFLEDFIFHSYLFKERMTFDLNIFPFSEENEIKVNNDFRFTTKKNSHLNKYKTHDKENKLGLVSLSFLFEDDRNSCIYTGDVGDENDLYLFNQKVDWFLTETTHIKNENLLRLLKESATKKLILTHISDDFEIPLNKFYESLPEPLKSRIILAFDGLELNQYNSGCL